MSVDLETIKRQVRAAQEEFAADVDAIVRALQSEAAALTRALGEISPEDALVDLRTTTVRAFERCLERRR